MTINQEKYLVIVPIMCRAEFFVSKEESDIKFEAFEDALNININSIIKDSIKPIKYSDDLKNISKEIEEYYIKDGYIISEPDDNGLIRVSIPVTAQMEITVHAINEDEAKSLAYHIALEKNINLINDEILDVAFYKDTLEDYLVDSVFTKGYSVLNYKDEFGIE